MPDSMWIDWSKLPELADPLTLLLVPKLLLILGYALTLLLIPRVLLTKKQYAVSTVAWILAIVLLPYLGGLLYLFFGINRVERRASRKHQSAQRISRLLPALSQYQLSPGEGLNPQQQRLMRIAHKVSGSMPTFGNQIELLVDTNRTMGLIEQAVRAAKETLHIEYYIWQPDRTGTRMRDLLIQKARQGVAVRFLYDAIGSILLSRRFLQPMRDAGIRVASFLPGATLRERWSINLRNHRKIVIVDGQTGFAGGMNVGDEYLGRGPNVGFWRDTHMKLRGPTVLQLQQVFCEDWFYATGEELTQPEMFPHPGELGAVSAQVVAGGPDCEINVFHSLMFAAINEARGRITLATSYFIPTPSLVTALETAACRGLTVRLLLSSRSSYLWTLLAGRSYYDTLLACGVEIYEYQRGLQHAKTLTIDGNWSMVGSPNFDARSLLLNFEIAVIHYDAKIAAQLEDQFELDLQHVKKIDAAEWSRRSTHQVLGENLCRLFAPIL